MNGHRFTNDFLLLPKKEIKHLLVIEGPTASGKTSLSIALAKHYHTCIVSADSRQFYKELAIGTAKPDTQEQDGVKHYFIDSHSIKDELTSAQFEKEALDVLNKEFKKNNVIILTGGSGMFIDALCLGLDDIPTSKELRNSIQEEYDENGIGKLLEELALKDPIYFSEVDKNNPVRIIRAIEVIRLTGEPYSKQRKTKKILRPFNVHRYVIDHDRTVLYDRINKRVDLMMEAGLLEEVKSVAEYQYLSSLNTVGYKEIFAYLDGTCTLEEAVMSIKQNTRRYAKRQLTWFRRHPEAIWIPYSDTNSMVDEITNKFNQDKATNESKQNLE